MALTCSLSLVPPIITSPAKLTSKSFSSLTPPNFHGIFTKSNNNSSKFLLNATFNLVEPDLNEDPIDQYRTNGIPPVLLSLLFCYPLHFSAFFLYTKLLFSNNGICLFCMNSRKSLSMEYLMVTILFMKEKRIKVFLFSFMLTFLLS